MGSGGGGAIPCAAYGNVQRQGRAADAVWGMCRQERPVRPHRRDVLAECVAGTGGWKVGKGVAGWGIWVILTRRSLRATQMQGGGPVAGGANERGALPDRGAIQHQ